MGKKPSPLSIPKKIVKTRKIDLEYHYWMCSRAVCNLLPFEFFRIGDVIMDPEIRQLDK